MSLTEIAHYCSFSDQSHFSRCFKNSLASLSLKVKIDSEKSAQLWIMADVGSNGNYSIELPEGPYRISPAPKNVNIIKLKIT